MEILNSLLSYFNCFNTNIVCGLEYSKKDSEILVHIARKTESTLSEFLAVEDESKPVKDESKKDPDEISQVSTTDYICSNDEESISVVNTEENNDDDSESEMPEVPDETTIPSTFKKINDDDSEDEMPKIPDEKNTHKPPNSSKKLPTQPNRIQYNDLNIAEKYPEIEYTPQRENTVETMLDTPRTNTEEPDTPRTTISNTKELDTPQTNTEEPDTPRTTISNTKELDTPRTITPYNKIPSLPKLT